MSAELPTLAELSRLAERCGFGVVPSDLDMMRALMAPAIARLNALEALPDALPPIKYPRAPGARPHGEANRYNAWCHKTSVKGAPGGKLAGKRIVLKDNIMLAGIPMMHGTSLLDGYVPTIDATVVQRILDAGGEIVGKAETECLSHGSGTTSANGPIHNPRKHGYTTGGSSSGCAALVAAGEVELAIGGDQGGSIRVPSSHCGIYGMKPTYGLVPFTGVMEYEPTLDHLGPMSNTVSDNALLLDVIAGPDGMDWRQDASPVQNYAADLNEGVAGLKIGILEEGFAQPGGEPDVDIAVMQAIETLAGLGARLQRVSLPLHRAAGDIWIGIGPEPFANSLALAHGKTLGFPGPYDPALFERLSRWRECADRVHPRVKVNLLLGAYLTTKYNGRFYRKAQNARPTLTAAYDALLMDVDLVAMPTVPRKAKPHPPAGVTLDPDLERIYAGSDNTWAACLTGHPAMSLPCGMSEGLPIGLMLVGRKREERTIYRAAAAFADAVDWTAT